MHGRGRAFVAHRTPTRIRIKFAGHAQPARRLATLEQILLQHPDIVRVSTNRLTASVVIECRRGFELAAGQRELLGLDARKALPCPHCGAETDAAVEAPSGTPIASLAARLALAISTRQVGVQLAEWLVEGVVHAARHQARLRAARPETVLAARGY